MSSLREVKDRIDSVRSTLKITSAMKLVASSKLRKAQRTIEALRPYQETLEDILESVLQSGVDPSKAGLSAEDGSPKPGNVLERASGNHPLPKDINEAGHQCLQPEVILAFSSNSSMCGAFNSNVIKKVLDIVKNAGGKGRNVEVWSFGKKMTEALRKSGTPAARDFSSLVARPDYTALAAVSGELRELRASGRIAGAKLVYNHFVSAGRQQVVAEDYIGDDNIQIVDIHTGIETCQASLDFILEPSRKVLLDSLLPLVNNLVLYTALLDSAAAEHAARMVAMQAATDNGQQLLAELTLEYNKGRQQKITSEILDLVGGSAQ